MMDLLTEKMKIIRKISIGTSYKNDAMHYAVGQKVWDDNIIKEIIEENDKYLIYIGLGEEIFPWKSFNKNMAIAVEYNIDY